MVFILRKERVSMKNTFLLIVLCIGCVLAAIALGQRGDRYTPETRLVYYAVDTAANDTYVASVRGIQSYTAGLFILLDPVTDNTGPCTLNINNLGAKALQTVLAQDPGNNHIDAAQIVPLCYNGTYFVIMTPDSNP
jgi:hypothetical protein